MIAIEGADNSGKSTLAKAIGLAYYSAGPAPKTFRDMQQCLKDQWARSTMPVVQDRLTCISQQVYSDDLTRHSLMDEVKRIVDQKHFILVYCRPPERILMDLSTHKTKSYDTEDSLQKIADHQHIYIERYDELMAKIPHLVYDWTDSEIKLQRFSELLIETQFSHLAWSNFRQHFNMELPHEH